MLVVVQVENVSVEELALFRRCTLSRRVVDSVLSLSITGCGTKSSIKGAGKDLAGNEGVEALSIKRGINSTGTIIYGIRVASRGGQGVISVAVGSSDQDLKFVAVLSMLSQDIWMMKTLINLTHSCWHLHLKRNLPKIRILCT